MKKPSDKRIAVGTVCGGVFPIPDIGIPLRLGTLPWDTCMACMADGCRSLLCEDGAGQQEEIEALTVEEQIPIICSIGASNDGEDNAGIPWDALGYFRGVAIDAASDEAEAICSSRTGDAWAEAEARIRSGEVRP